MHTKDKLADALEAAGLDAMAASARTGYYHDFLSPLDFPTMALVNDLLLAIKGGLNGAVRDLHARVVNGDFDATAEEAEEWADSPEGRKLFQRLKDGE